MAVSRFSGLFPGTAVLPFFNAKRPVPVFCWDRSDQFIPAVPPGLARFRALLAAYVHTRTFGYGGSAPSRILGNAFLFALGSPFLSASLPRFHPRRLSVRKEYGKYLLFFNGLSKDSTGAFPCASPRIVFRLFGTKKAVRTDKSQAPGAPGGKLTRGTGLMSCEV